jgi:hypothetical protein
MGLYAHRGAKCHTLQSKAIASKPKKSVVASVWIGQNPVKRKIYFGRPASRGVAQRPELYFIVQ